MSKTLIAGASTNPGRYAYLAADLMNNKGIPFELLSIKKGNIFGHDIYDIRQKPAIEGIDTITFYMSAAHQKPYYDYFISLAPKRLIFNPGAENAEFAEKAKKTGIKVDYACTLVLIQTGQFQIY
ncbi:MAG: CoA-binding protein [Cyclobacteriaceae bacterium]